MFFVRFYSKVTLVIAIVNIMSRLYTDIVDLLEQGYDPRDVSKILKCPIKMVYDIQRKLNT